MAKNQHRNLTGDALHNPKGFDGASNGTKLFKDGAGALDWITETQLPKALDYVSAQSAPPTEVAGDVYLIDTTGTAYDINTIAWQSGNTIRIAFNGSPDLSAVAADDYFITSGNGNSSNDGTFIITTVNDGSDYIEITNNDRSDATDDEATDAVGTGYYTLAEWDAVSKVSHVTFDGSIWSSITPSEGQSCYDVALGAIRVFDGTDWSSSLASGGITGSGTTNYLARWTPSGSALGNSVVQDNGSTVGINTSPLAETDLTTSRTSAASTASASIKTTISGSNTNTTKGIDITASNTSSGTVWGTITDISTSGTSNLLGHEVKIDTSGSGTITANAAYYVNQLDAGGTTTVSNAYGLLSDGVGGSGTTTNAYHLYLTAHSSGTNKYGIYQAGANDKNYFAGAMQFDTAAAAVGYVWTATDADGNGDWAVASGGGSSLWTDDSGGKISYSATNSGVQIYETGNANTYGAAVTIERGFLMVGDTNTIGHSVTATNVRRSVVFGGDNILGSEADAGYNIISGNGNDILSGDYNGTIGQNNIIKGDKNFSAGQTNLIYGDDNISLGKTNTIGTTGANVSRSVAIGEDVFVKANDQIVIGFGIDTNAGYSATKGIYVGIENTRPSSGWFTDPNINTTANFAIGGRETMRTDVGVIKAGTGAGIFYLTNYANGDVTEPTANAGDSVAMYAKDRTGGKSGLKIKAEDGTNHFFSDFSAIGGDETDAEANKTLTVKGSGTTSGTSSLKTTDSGGNATFEVLDNGTAKSAGQVGSSAGATPNTETPSGTTETIDWDNGNYQVLDLESASGNVTLTLSNPVAGFAYFIEIRQDSTTPLDVIFPSSVKFAGETAPYTLDVSTGANAVDAVSLAWNGSEYIASFSQNHG